jgi:hypothetical protein
VWAVNAGIADVKNGKLQKNYNFSKKVLHFKFICVIITNIAEGIGSSRKESPGENPRATNKILRRNLL